MHNYNSIIKSTQHIMTVVGLLLISTYTLRLKKSSSLSFSFKSACWLYTKLSHSTLPTTSVALDLHEPRSSDQRLELVSDLTHIVPCCSH